MVMPTQRPHASDPKQRTLPSIQTLRHRGRLIVAFVFYIENHATQPDNDDKARDVSIELILDYYIIIILY